MHFVLMHAVDTLDRSENSPSGLCGFGASQDSRKRHMRLIDTHTHLASSAYDGRVDAVLERSRQAGVDRWIAVGTGIDDSAAGIELCQAHEGLYCTVGVHPHEADKVDSSYLDHLRELSQRDSVCALGEMGLDYHYEFSRRPSQRRVFEEQLQLAGERALPVVVHCRGAFEDCLGILDAWDRPAPAVVFHCFSGDRSQARVVLDRGYFVSLTGTITFRNAGEAQAVAQYLPLDRVFLETDCPYLSPAPKRKTKPNEPALLVHTAAKLAELKGISMGEVAEVTRENSRCYYGIDQ